VSCPLLIFYQLTLVNTCIILKKNSLPWQDFSLTKGQFTDISLKVAKFPDISEFSRKALSLLIVSKSSKTTATKQCQADLNHEGCDPDADEQRVSVESLEDVTFAVDLASVHLVEQRHHHKRVEDDGEVLRRARSPKILRLGVRLHSTAVDVEHLLA